MKKKLLILGVLMAVILISAPALGWNGSIKYGTPNDVHLTQTYWWAKDVGFDDKSAGIISTECDQVDLGWRFWDKTWHLDRRIDTGGKVDTRLKHADEEKQIAKDLISQVPGKNLKTATRLRKQVDEHLGRGVHAIQDYYAHMDAGADVNMYNLARSGSSHGVNDAFIDSHYDDVLWDYTPTEGWHKHASKEESTRWICTMYASKVYLYDFLSYGYGPQR